MKRIVAVIDGFTECCGEILSWLTLGMMLLTCVVVAMRYVVGSGNVVFFQELVTYLHAAVFMLGAAWALKQGAHVRVDVFYRGMRPRTRAWVDSLGAIALLLPVTAFVFFISLDFARQAWSIREASAEAGGIPAVYLLKTLIPAMGALLFLQGCAELLRNAILLVGGDGGGD